MKYKNEPMYDEQGETIGVPCCIRNPKKELNTKVYSKIKRNTYHEEVSEHIA